jgi:hypothetical protein
MKRLIAPGILLLASLASQSVPANTTQDAFLTASPSDATVYIKALYSQKNATAEQLDLIAERLHKEYTNPEMTDTLVWGIKVIGQSKNQRYYGLLELIANNADASQLKKAARKSMNKLIISSHSPFFDKNKQRVKRDEARKMRSSIDHPLMSPAYHDVKEYIKELYMNGNATQEHLDMVAERMYTDYDSKYFVDTLAWACKLIGQSKDQRYSAALEHLFNYGDSSKLKKYAKKHLDRLTKPADKKYQQGDIYKGK